MTERGNSLATDSNHDKHRTPTEPQRLGMAKRTLAERSIVSVSSNAVAQLRQIGVGVVRSVLLARLLPVDVFGIYGWASSVVSLTSIVANFGMGSAFLHRTAETQDEQQAAAVQFTLQLLFTSAWTILLLAASFVLASGRTRTALLVLVGVTANLQLTHTPRLLLRRRVMHRRLALYQVINVFLSALVAVGLAVRGVTLWALLATDVMRAVVGALVFCFWMPVWKPRMAWAPNVVGYFLRLGSRQLLAEGLVVTLDRLDDLWTGVYLGDTALGYYSRAYTFATYPRKLLASPISLVASGTYAELKKHRHRLSKAFFRVNALPVRSGFVIAGTLSLIAPELIRIALGPKWLPFLIPFRLMLIYTLLDPIRGTVANLFVAVGRPEEVVRARAAQLVVLLAGLFGVGLPLGTTGVAIPADGMLLVGIVILLRQARTFVDFSPLKLLGVPSLSLCAGLALAWAGAVLVGSELGNWYSAAIKLAAFLTAYFGMLLALERRVSRLCFPISRLC